MATIELDGCCAWGLASGSRPGIGSAEGLQKFAEGAWEPPLSTHKTPEIAPAAPHHAATYRKGPLLWRSKTCPQCRRAYVFVTVGLATEMLGRDGRLTEPVDAPDHRLASAQRTVQRAYARSAEAVRSLLRHRDPLVRATALTRFRERSLGDDLLDKLLDDSNAAVRRRARTHIFRQLGQSRLPHARAALERAYPHELSQMCWTLWDEPRWLDEPSVRATLTRLAASYPEPVTRGRIAALLASVTPADLDQREPRR